MTEWAFSLVLVIDGEGPAAGLDYSLADALYERGCDDATLSVRDGVAIGDFDREADTAAGALWSAVGDIESVDGVRVHHAEPAELVSVAQIAERTGRSRQSVHQLAAGDRGPRTFPVPVSGVTERTRLWRWRDVVDWWVGAYPADLSPRSVELAYAISEVNDELTRKRGVDASDAT